MSAPDIYGGFDPSTARPFDPNGATPVDPLAQYVPGTNPVGDKRKPTHPSDIHSLVDQIANEEGLDPRLARAIAQIESGFNPKAKSCAKLSRNS